MHYIYVYAMCCELGEEEKHCGKKVIAAWKQFLWQAEELQENQKHWKQKECISTLWSEKLCKGTKVSDNGTAGKTQPTKIRYNACVNICRVSGPLELSIVMI